MLQIIFSSLLLFFLLNVDCGKLPEPEVKIEVMSKPFLCHRKSKYGDILLVHYEGFLESNGTLFHSRCEVFVSTQYACMHVNML